NDKQRKKDISHSLQPPVRPVQSHRQNPTFSFPPTVLGLSKHSSPGSSGRFSVVFCTAPRASGPWTFMRLLAAESTHTYTHHTTTRTMSCEQEFGDGVMGVTLTLRLLMHGK
ncbi:hypothetical protein ILYODFUR_038801, partial [Ilyodon furcidens]